MHAAAPNRATTSAHGTRVLTSPNPMLYPPRGSYTIGDHVYLLPEDEGSPLYIARIVRAFEDANAPDSDRLCIEVRAGVCVGSTASARRWGLGRQDL
jgi:hypothetical protein